MDIKEKITCIGCGSDFYTIITDNGKTYSWGENWSSQLGNFRLKFTHDYLKELCEVELSGKTIGNLFLFKTYSYRYTNVWIYLKFMAASRMYIICLVKVACGNSHTLALTDKGKVYVWGANWTKQSNPYIEDFELSRTMVNDKIIMTIRKT